ncbi:MAG: hypothetical protein Q9192_005645 [Flavoplaca navasiana]
MSTKIAILLLYKALFGVKRSFRYLCYGMMAIITSYCVIFFFILAFHCNPVQKAWQIITFRGPSKCFGIGTIQIVIGGFNIVTDFIILIMPMRIILGLNLDRKRKIGLLVIFGTGIVVLASTIVRQVIVVQHLHEIIGGPNTRNMDASWVTAQETLWLTVENDIGIICACLPSLAPLRTTRFFSKALPEFVSYLRTKSSHRSTKDGSSGHAPTKWSFKGVLGYHTSAESGVELVNNAPKNGEYVSANHGEGGLTHENASQLPRTPLLEAKVNAIFWKHPPPPSTRRIGNSLGGASGFRTSKFAGAKEKPSEGPGQNRREIIKSTHVLSNVAAAVNQTPPQA